MTIETSVAPGSRISGRSPSAASDTADRSPASTSEAKASQRAFQGAPASVRPWSSSGAEQLRIVTWPNRVLTRKCEPVLPAQVQGYAKLVNDMLWTCALERGYGLAAPQVGVPIRLIVGWQEMVPWALFNPVVERTEGSKESEQVEYCLSLPGVGVAVRRADEVRVTGLDAAGREVSVAANGMWARVLQHEADHLDGRLIWDHRSLLERDIAKRKYAKMRRR